MNVNSEAALVETAACDCRMRTTIWWQQRRQKQRFSYFSCLLYSDSDVAAAALCLCGHPWISPFAAKTLCCDVTVLYTDCVLLQWIGCVAWRQSRAAARLTMPTLPYTLVYTHSVIQLEDIHKLAWMHYHECYHVHDCCFIHQLYIVQCAVHSERDLRNCHAIMGPFLNYTSLL